MGKPMFSLGQIVATPGALEAMKEAGQGPAELLKRHVSGDWGECGKEDARENDRSVKHGYRILSVYKTKRGEVIWAITEADRSSTCLLLPSEY